MKLLDLGHIFDKVDKKRITYVFRNLTPTKRKYLLKYVSSKNLADDFYQIVSKFKLGRLFYLRKYNKKIRFTNDYLKNLYIIASFNQYNIDMTSFYKFWGLDKKEYNYIEKMLFVESDYLECKNHTLPIKGIIEGYYSKKEVLDYFNLKYRNFDRTKLSRRIYKCIDFLQDHNIKSFFPSGNYNRLKYNEVNELRDKYINKSVESLFSEYDMRNYISSFNKQITQFQQ